MNHAKWVVTMLLIAAMGGCADTKPDAPSIAPPAVTPPPVGSDRDAHGCTTSAGYLWCQATNQCERPWELAQKNHFPTEAFDKFCSGKP